MSMAQVMSTMPDVWRKVLAEHVPDQGQRCQACRNTAGEQASWPCQTYRIAQEAKWVSEGNLPGTGPHGSVTPSSIPAPSSPQPAMSSWDAPLSAGPLDTGSSFSTGQESYGSYRSLTDDAASLGGGSAYSSIRPTAYDSLGPSAYGSAGGTAYGASPEPSYGSYGTYGSASTYGSYDSYDRDPLGGRSLGGPADPPAHSGEVPGFGGGRHAGSSEEPYGSRMDAPYGASFGVDDQPRDRRW